MTHSRWRMQARRVLDREFRAWRERSGTIGTAPSEMSEAQKRDCLRHLSRAYPFGERSCHPYKAWLVELAAVKVMLGLLPTLMDRKVAEERAAWEGRAAGALPGLEAEG